MKRYPLVLEEQAANHGANVRVEVTHADLTEAATNTAQTLALLNVDAKMAVRLVKAVLVTPFQDASDAGFNTCAATVGDGSDVDRLLASMELNVNGTEVLLKPGPASTNLAAVSTADGSDAATTQALANALKAAFNLVVAALNAGNGHVYTAADTVDLVVNSMSGKALVDIDVGELHLYFQVMDHR